MVDISEKYRKSIMDGDQNTVLPIISYYSTSRLYAIKKEALSDEQFKRFSRQDGYTDCLNAKINENSC